MNPIVAALLNITIFTAGAMVGFTIGRIVERLVTERRNARLRRDADEIVAILKRESARAIQQFEYMANGASPGNPSRLGTGLSPSELERLRRIANRKDPEA